MIPKAIELELRQIRRDLKAADFFLESGRRGESLPHVRAAWSRLESLDREGAAAEFPLSGRRLAGPEYLKLVHDLMKRERKRSRMLARRFRSAPERAARILAAAALLAALAGAAVFSVPKLHAYSKTGLKGEYFVGTNFDRLIGRGVNRQIYFDQGEEIFRKLPFGGFSVRWTGWLLVPKDGVYVFSFVRDNGVRFYLDDKLVVDAWRDDVGESRSEPIQLAEGPHAVRIEFFDNVPTAALRFQWSADGGAMRLVTPDRLRQEKPS